MTFPINVGIPAANNDPADDQPLMQNNFANIASFLAVDHIAAGSVNAGNHRQVHLPNQAAPGIAGGAGVLYANTVAGQSYPFWQNAVTSYPLITLPTATATGTTTIPGGIIIKWGTGTISASGTATAFVFSTAFPTTLFSIVLGFINNQGNSPSANSAFIKSGTQSVAGFSVTNSSGSSSQAIYYIAIGN